MYVFILTKGLLLVHLAKSMQQIVEHLKTQQLERPAPEADLCEWIWQGMMRSIDWTARTDQIDNLVVSEVTVSQLHHRLHPVFLFNPPSNFLSL